MNGRRVVADFRVFSRSYFRNPIALFFSLVFPIILILLFGVITDSGSTSKVTLEVQNLDGSSYASHAFLAGLNQTGVISISLVSPSAGNLSKYLAANDLQNGLVIPQGFGQEYLNNGSVNVTVYTDPASPATAGVVQGAVGGVINALNLEASHGKNIIGVKNLAVGSQVYGYLDYLTPGLIGFSILTSPMFSMVNIIAEYKKDRIFKQLSLTPLTKAEWLTSKIIWFVALSVVAAFIIIIVSTSAFGTHVNLTPMAIPFLIVGPLLFVSLGMVAGVVAKTPESAAVIGNIITFPMMFLAGTFFPVSSFSPGLQAVAHLLPLYYVIDGLNNAMIFANTGQALVDLVITTIMATFFFVLAVVAFRWKEA
jgi:ABC-2 type transport system permease protein